MAAAQRRNGEGLCAFALLSEIAPAARHAGSGAEKAGRAMTAMTAVIVKRARIERLGRSNGEHIFKA